MHQAAIATGTVQGPLRDALMQPEAERPPGGIPLREGEPRRDVGPIRSVRIRPGYELWLETDQENRPQRITQDQPDLRAPPKKGDTPRPPSQETHAVARMLQTTLGLSADQAMLEARASLGLYPETVSVEGLAIRRAYARRRRCRRAACNEAMLRRVVYDDQAFGPGTSTAVLPDCASCPARGWKQPNWIYTDRGRWEMVESFGRRQQLFERIRLEV